MSKAWSSIITTAEHVCNFASAWPVGHPLPPEEPTKLQGPELGFVIYQPTPLRNHIRNAATGETVIQTIERPAIVVRVIERSYVWSPGECCEQGGYRHYDWSVIEEGPNKYRAVVVNDTDLRPLPEGQRVNTVYTLQRSVSAGEL